MASPAILVVDDESSVRQLVERILSGDGWKVETASNGNAALESLSRGQHDLVLTDFKMPAMSGTELSRYVQEHYRGTDVILMSGQATLESAMEAFQYGVYDYLLKPFTVETLRASVNRWRRLWEVERVLRETESVLDKAVSDLVTELRELLEAEGLEQTHQKRLQKAMDQIQELSALLDTLRTWSQTQRSR